jgi:transposase
VLCVDEKSQIQALDRTQPGLPLIRGRCGTFTHEYKRHGTTCLFAALHVAKGNVVAECYPRHRHQEFIRFLRRLETEFPAPRCLHLILDNYAIHGHERVRAWLRKRPRMVLHFIPTSSSWLNLVERWFAELEQKTVRRGAFHSVAELRTAIEEFLTAWNDAPRPYTWSASVERILAKVERCRQRLDHRRGDAHRVGLLKAHQAHLQGQGAQAVAAIGLVLLHQADLAEAHQVGVRLGRSHASGRGQLLQGQRASSMGQGAQQLPTHLDALDATLFVFGLGFGQGWGCREATMGCIVVAARACRIQASPRLLPIARCTP